MENKTTSERKICPYYKAAILASSPHNFNLEKAIEKYATCDGADCEQAVIRVDRDGEELKTVFVRCGRREA